MTVTITAYPLQWPPGWRRADSRKEGAFNKKVRLQDAPSQWRRLSIADGAARVRDELYALGIKDRDDIVISTGVPVNLAGDPRGGAADPADPGVAVYWLTKGAKQPKCIAIDRYRRVADNLAAIAATLDAMRAIERHGGAEILDRAFAGFIALPAPEQWFQVLGIGAAASREQIEGAYRKLAMQHHPDRPGGNPDAMARINAARDDGLRQAK